jgi:diguanylate cyclase (GGDEF)-like protein/PAS domain S-box-containing protein
VSAELFHEVPCGLLVTDGDDVVTVVNDTLLAWTGHRREEVVGRPFASLLDDGSQAFYATRHRDELWSRGEAREIVLTLRRPDGGDMPILLNAALADTSHGTEVRVAVFDATVRAGYEREATRARRKAEASETSVRLLHEAAARFLAASDEDEWAAALVDAAREAFAASEVAVALYDADGIGFRVVGPQHLRPLLDSLRDAREPGSRALRPDQVVLHPDLDAAYAASVAVGDGLREHRAEAFSGIAITADEQVIGALCCLYGRARDFDAPTMALQRALAQQAGLAFSRIRLQAELRRAAARDQLTGLANRKTLDDGVAAAVRDAADRARPMSLLFLDLDGFKRVNDELGHRFGDVVLTAVAQRLRDAVRGTDAVGRFGGDEFMVLCPDADAAVAESIARRIAEAIAQPVDGVLDGYEVTASIGVVVYTPEGDAEPDTDAMLRNADAAMYASKRAGRGRVTVVAV